MLAPVRSCSACVVGHVGWLTNRTGPFRHKAPDYVTRRDEVDLVVASAGHVAPGRRGAVSSVADRDPNLQICARATRPTSRTPARLADHDQDTCREDGPSARAEGLTSLELVPHPALRPANHRNKSDKTGLIARESVGLGRNPPRWGLSLGVVGHARANLDRVADLPNRNTDLSGLRRRTASRRAGYLTPGHRNPRRSLTQD